jgi:macrodomain Ter protein organizer (MatP/YcbG family)
MDEQNNKLIHQLTDQTKENRGGARNGAGLKPIGITRKISLTLPQSCWEEIDRLCKRGDYSISEIVRSIIEDQLHNADQF